MIAHPSSHGLQLDIQFDLMDYCFSNHWFEAHKPSWKKILTQKSPTNILEVGSYEGQSAVFSSSLILDTQSNSVSLTCIDTWQGGKEHLNDDMRSVEEKFDHNMSILTKTYQSRFRFRKIKDQSFSALSKLVVTGENHYDFVYIDGSHDACDVLSDAILGFKLLSVNGLMCFDDFLWHIGDRNPLYTPRQGIEAFISCYRDKIFLFDSGQSRQCWLIKTDQ